ncbi:MAG TPA: BtrH N-terminal domain-containing protein [Nocardioidaceae bacterium]|nr:BtrH N-terminal domain-containing protein [Nocardioidaceae bacterium]
MTENKLLKARVRARMARTGESYSTAHRHVVAARENSRAVPGVVTGYDGFDAYTHRHSALSARLLTQAGCEIDEPLACGLGGGIGFMYAVFEYKQVDHPLLTIVAQHHPQPWLPTVAEHLGIGLSTQHSSSARAALGKLEKQLTEGRPALLLVARGELPWHHDGLPEEAADPYPVVVAGARDDSFLVDDVPGGPQLLGADQLAQAWSAHRKGRHELTTVASVPSAVDLREGARGALGLTVRHLTGPVLGNAFDVNFGFSGMEKLAAELREPRKKAGWVSRFGEPAAFAYATTRLAECLTTAYTAPGATRPLYAKFLTRTADLLEAPALHEAAEAVAASGAQWEALAEQARAAAEASAGDVAPGEVFARLAEHVDAAADHERRATELIRSAVSV